MDEGLKPVRQTGIQKLDGTEHVGVEHAFCVLLGGVGSVGRQVEDPVGARGADGAGEGLGVGDGGGVEAEVGFD